MLTPTHSSLALLAAAVLVPLVAEPAPPMQGRGHTAAPAAPPQDAPGSRRGTTNPPQQPEVPKPAPLVPREELTNEQMAAKYFALADYDADGAITYFEAQKSLGLDRAGLAIYDKDHDGRISPEEFEQRYVNIVTRGGIFPPPVPKPKAQLAPRRTAPELLQAYDQTPDGGLDERELRKLLEDYAAPPDPPAKVLLATLDRDASHRLEVTELEALIEIVMPKPKESEPVKKQTLAELFGHGHERELPEGAAHQPLQILGPVSTFRRLDLDDDGRIELTDLTELQRPIQLHVRVNAVFTAFDIDGDGAISQAELEQAFSSRKP